MRSGIAISRGRAAPWSPITAGRRSACSRSSPPQGGREPSVDSSRPLGRLLTVDNDEPRDRYEMEARRARSMDPPTADISLGLYHTKDGERAGRPRPQLQRAARGRRASLLRWPTRWPCSGEGSRPSEGNAALIHFPAGPGTRGSEEAVPRGTKDDPPTAGSHRAPSQCPIREASRRSSSSRSGAGRTGCAPRAATADVPSRAPAIAAALAKLAELRDRRGQRRRVPMRAAARRVDRFDADARPEPARRAARGGDEGLPWRAGRAERSGVEDGRDDRSDDEPRARARRAAARARRPHAAS